MPLQLIVTLAAIIPIALIIFFILDRHRLGELNAASWLVILGVIVVMTEHPLFAIAYSIPLPSIADDLQKAPMLLLPHAHTHFLMAGVYTLVGLALLSVIARTLLREGRRSGWFSILFATVIGGSSELFIGGLWYQHGSPIYNMFGLQSVGFGWQFLYTYIIAWIAALMISFRPVFEKRRLEHDG